MRLLTIAAILCALLAIPFVWEGSQGWLFPDGTCYLDLATNVLHGAPSELLKNGYWSPGYPAVLAAMMAVVRPSLLEELHDVFILNWLIFLFTTGCFSFLIAKLLEWMEGHAWPELRQDARLRNSLIAFSYVFYLLANMNRTMWYITPDMLMQGLAYLSVGLAIRLFLPDPSWKTSALIGLTLGLAYLTKGAMFPPALMLLAVLFLKPPKDTLGRRHALLAVAIFLAVASPLVLSLSAEKHRLTFGDSGKLNYSWFVGGVRPQQAGWIGQHPENGTPVHPVRALSEQPLVIEFRHPVSGTLPIWYDPSYWWDGLKLPLSLRSQMGGLLRPFTQVHSKQTLLLALAILLAPLCLLNARVRQVIREGGIRTWLLIVWPAAACLMYTLAVFNFRYTIAYLVLMCLGAATLILQPFRSATRARALFALSALLVVGGLLRLTPILKEAILPKPRPNLTIEDHMDNRASSIAVADELARLGIHPGDEISVLGHSFDCYYARLAQIRIVAQIWEAPDDVVNLGAGQVQEILSKLKQTGVKALIARSRPGFANDNNWIRIPRTDVFVRML